MGSAKSKETAKAKIKSWIPAFAGMTTCCSITAYDFLLLLLLWLLWVPILFAEQPVL